MRILVAATLVLPLLAGCIQTDGVDPQAALPPGPSLPRFDLNLTVFERLALKTEDGVTLDLVAARPDVEAQGAAGEKLPVIVDIGPYFGNLGGDIMTYTAIDLRLLEYFGPRGYVVARASLRGTGESEGCFDLGGKTEQKDVHDIVEFLAKQPWSNGNVAVFGKSYDGTTPWMAAITQAPSLRTIVPISGISDMYRYMFYDGAIYPEEELFNTYYYLLVDNEVTFPGPDGGPPTLYNTDPQHHLWKNVVRTCDGLVEQTLGQTHSVATGDHGTDFWLERDYERSWDKVQVPVFMVHGLQDWNVKPDHQVPLFNDLKVPKALWLGQWAHDYPDINRFNADWSRHDWNETLLVWFDHWLKGVDNDWESLAHVEAQDQTGNWTTYDAWPPADAVEVEFHLTPDGKLAGSAPAGALSFLDPLQQGFDPATGERGHAFLSGPFPANATFLGRGFADLHLSVDRPGGLVAIRLYDVDESGEWTEVDHGARDLRHRHTREKGEPVTPGERFNTSVWLYPQEIVIAKGHRLALVVESAQPDWFEKSPFLAGTYELRLGDDASALHLLVRADGVEAAHAAMGMGEAGHAHDATPTLLDATRA